MFRAMLFAALAASASFAVAQPIPAPVAAETIAYDAKEGREVVAKLADALEGNFVFPDVGQRYAAALRANLAAGSYDNFTSARIFAAKLTADLQAVAKDGHLRVFAPSKDSGGSRRMMAIDTDKSSILAAEWKAPGVAYISFDMFSGNAATLSAVRDFMAKTANAESLIIDLRANRGGGVDEMDLMFAQLFTRPTELLDMETRPAAVERSGDPWAGIASIRQLSAPATVIRRRHSATPAANPTWGKTKLYLLTSRKTASAAEHFALALKRHGRAVLIGETTYGAGHYFTPIPLGHGYMAAVPVGRTFDPTTNQGWEGVGIKPDIAVPADDALDKALQLAGLKTASMAGR